MPSREEVDRFLSKESSQDPVACNLGWTYDATLGWVLKDAVRHDGVDGSRTFYHYEEHGCRMRIHFSQGPCRIHTYGDSFTHCDQVSDGETWQEYLAAHLQESIMNFGVGGYSVYQAYLRMLREEEKAPAEYIILNIWDDDHFRNLDAWRSIRFGRRTSCGFPLPHLRVNLQGGECREMKNLYTTPVDLYKLTDSDSIFEAFKDDPILQVVLATTQGAVLDRGLQQPVAVSFGLPLSGDGGMVEEIKRRHAEAALSASQKILEWMEKRVAEKGQKMMLILSHSSGGIRRDLLREPRWDQSFLDFLRDKSYPIVDLRDAHAKDFGCWRGDVDSYLRRYYNGHYSPAGNYFCAQAIKGHVVTWLNPKPRPYRSEG